MALWDKLRSRGNVDDRRSFGPQGTGLGVGGVVLLVAITYLSGGDLSAVVPTVLNELSGSASTQQYNAADFEGADSYEVFASTVLGSSNEYWLPVLAARGVEYRPPTLVLFRGGTYSSCGGATRDIGPHYCPSDETIYLDETFFDELTTQFGATGGDVAEAYVIAHEVGHHVQNLLGTSQAVQRDGTNESSIRLELQADCFAGLWAGSIRNFGVLEPGEIQEAIDAAAAVGDDRIQESIQGRITPETWTHGSSEERVRWFTRGYENGTLETCATFS